MENARIITLAMVTLLLLFGCSNNEDTAPVQESETTRSAESEDVAGPKVSVTADKTHAVQPGDEIVLTVTVTDFALEASKIGQANEPGVGHYHVYLDDATGDDYLGVSADVLTKVKIPEDITDGSHDVRVVLHNNDHTPVSPPAVGSVLLIVYRLD